MQSPLYRWITRLTGASLALVASAALADGFDRRGSIKDAPHVAPFSWSGFYIGAHAGYGFGGGDRISTSYLPSAAAFNGQPFATSIDSSGFIGGGQIGYNMQAGRLVLGIEADISYTGMDDTVTVAPFLRFGGISGGPGTGHSFKQELDWLGTVRARIGLPVSSSMLIYATGGLAYGRTQLSAVTTAAPNDPTLLFVGSTSRINTGWTIGGGVEAALGSNWSLKGEYLYYDLGDQSVLANRVQGGPAGFMASHRFDSDGHIVRGGLNYRF